MHMLHLVESFEFCCRNGKKVLGLDAKNQEAKSCFFWPITNYSLCWDLLNQKVKDSCTRKGNITEFFMDF